MSFPSKKEIEQLIKDGAKCLRCNKRPATLAFIQAVPSMGHCEECQKELKKKYPPIKEGMGGNELASVWTAPGGENIPVNKKGNVIHTTPKYTKRKGTKPLW